jgi:hypothetical protein
MQKLGSGVVTTTQDVDCVEFDWGKIHFLKRTVSVLVSWNCRKGKGTRDTTTPAPKKLSMSYRERANKW